MPAILDRPYRRRRLNVRAARKPPPSNGSAAPTVTAANAGLDLTRHSLNAVVACNKTLWQPPLKWTRAHLSALGIRNKEEEEEEDDSDGGGNDDKRAGAGGRGGGNDNNYRVVLPDLAPALLDQLIQFFMIPGPYETHIQRLDDLIRMPRPTDGHGDADGNKERCDDGVIARPLDCRMMTPELAIGPRKYKLIRLYHLLVSDTLLVPYLDSTCVPRPQVPPYPLDRPCDWRRCEPFIAAVLISRAQSLAPSLLGEKGVEEARSDCDGANYPVYVDTTAEKSSIITVRNPILSLSPSRLFFFSFALSLRIQTDNGCRCLQTQLFFTHRFDDQGVHVYTAHISRALLDRFRYPNQPSTATTGDSENRSIDRLIRLDHRRVPCKPHATFRQRLLAALSITSILKPCLQRDVGDRKRVLAPNGCIFDFSPKRPRHIDEKNFMRIPF